MSGDPKKCRQHALNCMLLAKQATSEEGRNNMLQLAQTWTKLAVELEQAETFLKRLAKENSEGQGG
jgi:hypothetical protein